ncbi:MAG: type I methionyl aminopeptidase [Patescibacteria group bacterium]
MAIDIKTPEEMETMAEGGARLRRVKNALASAVKIGVSALDIENLAMKLINEEGALPSFTKVENYRWATCISVNEGIVHGIPKKETIFKKGDLVSVDVGIFYKGFHTDTSISVGLDLTPENVRFFETGRTALKKAIREAKPGKYIFDISKAIEDTITGAGYTPLRALVGHGVGRELHEEPQIPCFVPDGTSRGPKIVPGMVLAIEVMYTQGKSDIGVTEDGWTIVMRDGKISALFEETVCVTTKGPQVIT